MFIGTPVFFYSVGFSLKFIHEPTHPKHNDKLLMFRSCGPDQTVSVVQFMNQTKDRKSQSTRPSAGMLAYRVLPAFRQQRFPISDWTPVHLMADPGNNAWAYHDGLVGAFEDRGVSAPPRYSYPLVTFGAVTVPPSVGVLALQCHTHPRVTRYNCWPRFRN